MTTSTKPTLLLIGGSFSPASAYDPLASRLRAANYETIIPQLLTVGKKTPTPTLEDDVALIRGILADLVDAQGKDVMLIAHSYGGVPSTQSTEGYSKAARQEQGKKGGVVRILYTTAVVPEIGQSAAQFINAPLPDYVVVEDENWARLLPEGTAKNNFLESEYELGLEWAKTTQEHSLPALGASLTYPGYKDVPVSYAVFEKDQVVLPEKQLAIVERLEKECGAVDVYKLPFSHAAHMSQPNEVMKVIVEAAGKNV